MGAICGILDLEKKGLIDLKLLKRINNAMIHRGPDDEGYFIDRGIGLGCRTLKTITSKEKLFPISNEDGSIQLVVDGELYNFYEIKETLEKKGHKFYTENSCEIIIHLYGEYQEKFVQFLDGIFSFALWDSNKKKLIIGRDRFGTKPLYYAIINKQFLFSSELKSFIKHPSFKKNIDPFTLRYCLQFWYIMFPDTIFKDVRKVQPGSILVIKKNEIKEKVYWELTLRQGTSSISYYKKAILEKLKKSLTRRYVGEYPMGVLLSGGIDSSSIVALLSEIGNEPIRTYSVGFQEKGYYNELKYAKIVAEKFNTEHSELLLDSNAVVNTPKTIRHMEYPTGIPNLNLNYSIYKIAKKKSKIIFVGDGADEFFAPDICRRIHYMYKLRFIPFFIRGNITKYINSLRLHSKHFEYLRNFSIYADNIKEMFFLEKQKFSNYDVKHFTDSKLSFNVYQKNKMKLFKNLINKSKSQISFNQIQYSIFKTYFTNMVLELVDRMGMASSIEKRYPFLDYKLVEVLCNIPLNLKLRSYEHKFLLQKSVMNILPKEIIYRKKEPFLPLTHLWVKDQKEIISHFVSEFKKRHYLENKFIDKLLEFKDLKKSSDKLWALFVAELWFRMFIDNENIKEKDLTIGKLW